MAVDWESKYGDKVKFFEHAQSMGVHIPAMEERPLLGLEEQFFISAFATLSTASYSSISQFCKDFYLSIEERSDLLQVISSLNAHLREKERRHANIRTNTGRKQGSHRR